ncbi:MAG TPA: PD-(D/E)XK nuclease family protein [Aridibacter sp.]|nr:PD-(D/E)XK nuclease family protein [Aridibacter sp.]
MALNDNKPIWTAAAPAVWPDPPPEMTVTALGGIESCPRRWALGAAYYPELWNERGYPPRVQLGALSGTVVHLALEVITRALVKASCQSLQDPAVFRVMKDLGGYTTVVNDCIDQALERLAGSPRAQSVLEYAGRSLRAKVPEFRTRAQTMLCRLHLPRLQVRGAESGASGVRGPLAAGAFPEIGFRAEQIGWKGKADLLVLSSHACEITDFKTGAPDEEHQFQIRVYALLWNRDADLNPNQRRADRLILSYGSGDVEVAAPSESELDELEMLLVARGDAARQTVLGHPPEARPAPDHCRYCTVRHLCTDYWNLETQSRLTQADVEIAYGDFEVTITGRHGPSSWNAQVEISSLPQLGKQSVIRSKGTLEFQTGDRIRILDAAVTRQDDEEELPYTITLGSLSEVYRTPGK